MTAVVFPVRADVGGRSLPVWPMEQLVASQLQADRPKDRADLQALWQLRLFEPAEVLEVLAEMLDKEAIAALERLVERPSDEQARRPLPSRER
jgi:hypothetical protein